MININILSFFDVVVDRSGLESVSTSDAFTIDITPPIPGKFFVGNEKSSDKTIVGNNIPVNVEGFEDPESGVDMINVRIAGINTDYVSNTIVDKGLYKIKLSQDLKDGYEYRATIQVGIHFTCLQRQHTLFLYRDVLVIRYYVYVYM